MNDLDETAQSIDKFNEMASEAKKILPLRSARDHYKANQTYD